MKIVFPQPERMIHALRWRAATRRLQLRIAIANKEKPMLQNYIKIALRNLVKYKAYSFINICGLGIGIACCLVILLYVQNELSYDGFHDNVEQVYRLTTEVVTAGEPAHLASSPAPVIPAILEDFSEISAAARVLPSYNGRILVRYNEQQFYETRYIFADPAIFEVFTYRIIKGNPQTTLNNPNSVVVTERFAEKYFGDAEPINQVFSINIYGNDIDYTVTAVMENPPSQSHLDFDFMLSFVFFEDLGPDDLNGFVNYLMNWENGIVFTYLRFQQGTPPAEVEARFPAFVAKHRGEDATELNLHLQRLTDIHLHSRLENEMGANGDIRYVYLFSAIAFFILLIACINFMNLATARSAKRAKEIGMRKVLGAQRLNLIHQYLGESLLITLLAMLLALSLVEALLPVFNHLVEQSLAANYAENFILLGSLAGLTLLVGIVSGSYPAFVLSGFRPIQVLKGEFSAGSARAAWLRKGLVVGQFTIAIVLMVGTGVIYDQLDYIRTKKLGFTKEHTILISIWDPEIQQRTEEFKQEFLRLPEVTSTATASYAPGGQTLGVARFVPEGAAKEDDFKWIEILGVDHDYIKTLGLKIAAGRDFSREFSTDESAAFLINEAAAKLLGWEDPLGKRLTFQLPAAGQGWMDARTGEIIGVVEDFHFKSLHQKIEPLAMTISSQFFAKFLVKTRPGNLAGTVAALKEIWRDLAGNRPFEYRFLDQQFHALYRFEEKVGQLFGVFAGLAIFIACLGLLGLAAFTAQHRTKEVGIRKVLGASVTGIVILISREFLKLVGIAFIVAAPVTYFVMQSWLQYFAYHVEMGAGTFLLAGIIAFLIAWGTVGYQSIKAALANPVDSLRYE